MCVKIHEREQQKAVVFLWNQTLISSQSSEKLFSTAELDKEVKEEDYGRSQINILEFSCVTFKRTFSNCAAA